MLFRMTQIIPPLVDRRHPLAAGGHRRAHRARMARPRVAGHDAEVSGAVEGNRKTARRLEVAVLKCASWRYAEGAELTERLGGA